MLTAAISPDGACHPIHGVSSRTARPLGSMFKLYVLAAVAEQIDAGELSWDDTLKIMRASKSLPSGVLQDKPVGSTVTVREAATKMISISDNTAADLLAHRVGRAAVQAAQRDLDSHHADRNTPFLRTRELFALKGSEYPHRADTYLKKSPSGRLRYLQSTIDEIPRSKIRFWDTPRDVDRLEWFASPDDICRAWSGLTELAKRPGLTPLDTILSVYSDLPLDAQHWHDIWYKGGSEPGVLTMGWRAKTAEGATVVTVLMTENTLQPIKEASAVPELLTLAEGAFHMALDDLP